MCMTVLYAAMSMDYIINLLLLLLFQIYVWHTRTEKPSMLYENQLKKMGYPSSDKIEV